MLKKVVKNPLLEKEEEEEEKLNVKYAENNLCCPIEFSIGLIYSKYNS